MKALLSGSALALALLLTGCGDGGADSAATGNAAAPLTPIAAPAGQDWTATVTQTADGGYLLGNPNAPVKLVEYASLTCPACAAFSDTATTQLRDQYVKSGQVSWEFRNFVLNPIDLGVSMLARCQAPNAFFRSVEQLYATQPQWMAAFQTLPPAEQQRLQSLPAGQQVGALIKAGGADAFFRQRGMPQARVDSCLADQQGLQRLVDMTETGGSRDGVTGTPSFMLNGELVDGVSTWADLEPKLREAIG